MITTEWFIIFFKSFTAWAYRTGAWKVVLFAGEDEPDFSDEYATHLDRLASGLESEWEYPEVMDEEE